MIQKILYKKPIKGVMMINNFTLDSTICSYLIAFVVKVLNKIFGRSCGYEINFLD